MKRTTKYILGCGTILATCLWISAAGQMPNFSGSLSAADDDVAAQLRADSIARADSIECARVAALAQKAADDYKHLKFVQYEGTTESELYPESYAVYQSTLQALNEPKLSDSDATRLRGVLLDINPLLIKGAVFYSSEGNQQQMNRFAQAAVDTRMRPDMKSFPWGNENKNIYPSLVYVAASQAYNNGDFPHSIDYLLEYLNTGASERREQVASFLGQACIKAQTPERGIDRLIEATTAYPTNYNLLMITLQNCVDGGYNDRMPALMERALLMRPDDEQLLNLQAQFAENEGDYIGALDAYSRLFELHPSSLNINKHLALCYYNLGVENYNKSVTESSEKDAKRYARQSHAYFSSAMNKLGAVVDNDPSNPKYLKALAMTYGSLGETGKLQELNTRLQALGMSPVKVSGMPESIAYDDSNAAAKSQASSQQVPDFQDYARSYVENGMAEFAKRREFERKEDFEKRINENNVYQEYQRLCKDAEYAYLKKYASRLRISDLQLEPYDIDNETYRIISAMGPMVVHVPLKGKEAEMFKASWEGIQLRNAKYFIDNNRVGIASVDLVTPGGKTYTYNAEKAANYAFTEVQVDLQSFIAQGNTSHARTQQGGANNQTTAQNVIRAKSDVDKDIPVTSRRADKTVAVIWANENYKNVTQVQSALNDGETFAQYCKSTLGIPESQVILHENLTYAEMLGSVQRLKQLVGALGDGVDVIFYYAGHGIPDEGTKDSFLLPIDGDGKMTVVTYPLKKLYADLSSMRAQNVMVFLDACFSGATRDGGMLAEARGVALKPRPTDPEGSMYVLSAASDQETALPYTEKNHGLFTYFLLKKLQESKGNVTLKDLADYVQEQVKKNSLTVNHKIQTPSVQVSGNLANEWTRKKMRN